MGTIVSAPIAQRLRAGRGLREKAARKSHALWKAPANRPDPIRLLIESDAGRIPKLLPIRYGRMRQSPFAFLRGAAGLMAFDLAGTPRTGLRVQACGDCHIMNFGAFATPERNLVFDINDFDETLPAPWEWDVKRLTVSIEVAGRSAGIRSRYREHAVRAAVRSYREHLAEYATMPSLEVWYQRIDFQKLLDRVPGPRNRRRDKRVSERARRKTVPNNLLPSMAARDQTKIKDEPPLIYHLPVQRTSAYLRRAVSFFKRYRTSLPESYRVLFDRFELLDVAFKVVGVGSVGTFCEVALFRDAQAAPLFLQIKEARASVLEPYAGRSLFSTHGQRVVYGQRLMQASSDIFLGWTVGLEPGRDFYVRQMRDMKIPMPVDTENPADLAYFADACGWALARAHARTGDPAMIAGYLGSSDAFDDAIVKFAKGYADQTESDYSALLKAIRSGRIKVAR
ncbi:MAG: DUF2252 domain-containing protein [Candidatus Binatus sp.]|jgi:uncharacterized protein (DUF2252 family)|uniref:DUF2252 domain-containing protein n=1 Tax=Candidatus Binatus sp. TaxID=2811406 RepID=UPI003CBB8FDD